MNNFLLGPEKIVTEVVHIKTNTYFQYLNYIYVC